MRPVVPPIQLNNSQSKTLKIRRHLVRQSKHNGYEDCDLPFDKNYNYDNYLKSISSDGRNRFNFTLSNGISTSTGAPEIDKVIIHPPDSLVRKVRVWCGSGTTVGIEMFNNDDESVLEIGEKKFESYDFDLAEGERIVGVWSRLYQVSNKGHCHLTFVIGWLE